MKPLFDVLRATAGDLQTLLSSGRLTSVSIVEAYITQIERHNKDLHAVLQVSPKAIERAKALDLERSKGILRGPLHGIPILLKDNIATHPEIGLDTTAGSYAFKGCKLKSSADIVEKLLAAGVIILGKSNMSELAGFKGSQCQPGWSAVGGQTQSAYVRGGLVPDGSILGHSSPGGSSTGSAVGVSAGFAPVAIGTETDGSLNTPSNRAALYSIRPTIGLVSGRGVLPISYTLDTPGPMAKSVKDLADLLTVLVDQSHPSVPKGGYSSVMTTDFHGIRIGLLDPEVFVFAPEVMKPDEGARVQMNSEIRTAYKRLAELGATVHENIEYVTLDDLEYKKDDVVASVMNVDFKTDFESYLELMDECQVKSLEDLILFNAKNKDKELPPECPDQKTLENALKIAKETSRSERNDMISWMRKAGGEKGIDHFLKKYNIDVIIGPADCECTEPPAAAGYPLAMLPLSTLDLNGRPFGLSVTASAHQEALLIKVLSAWEANFPPRAVPPLLESGSGGSFTFYKWGLILFVVAVVARIFNRRSGRSATKPKW